MNNDDQSPDSGTDQLRPVVTSFSKDLMGSEGIPEEHQPYAEQVLAMDPIRDVKGSISDDSMVRPGYQLKLTTLPEPLQEEARSRLRALGAIDKDARAAAESDIVAELIRGKLGSIRAKTGVHRHSLPFHKTQAEIAAQVETLQRKRQGYQDAMDKVVDVRKVEDPETGELSAEPIYWLSENTRQNYANVISGIDRDIRLLVKDDGSYGIEANRRLQGALRESAAILHERATVRREEEKAQKLAADMVSQERIQKRAEILAKMRTR